MRAFDRRVVPDVGLDDVILPAEVMDTLRVRVNNNALLLSLSQSLFL